MNKYEALFIISPDYDQKMQEQMLNEITDVVVKNEGLVEKKQIWEKRVLGYKVKKKKEGIYLYLSFQLNPKLLAQVNHSYRMDERILKSQIVRLEN